MNNKSGWLSLLIFICIGLASCKKNEQELTPPSSTNSIQRYYYLDSKLFPFLFDSGSFWVYRDTATNNIDSIALTNRSKTASIFSNGPGNGPSTVEIFALQYFSSFTSSSYYEFLYGGVISKGVLGGPYIYMDSKTKGDTTTNIIIKDILSSVQIENNFYKNVVKIKAYDVDSLHNNYNLYYADSIGVIRKEKLINDSITEVWNLLRYKTFLFKYY